MLAASWVARPEVLRRACVPRMDSHPFRIPNYVMTFRFQPLEFDAARAYARGPCSPGPGRTTFGVPSEYLWVCHPTAVAVVRDRNEKDERPGVRPAPGRSLFV